jgi:hypothetical protein
MERLQYVLLRLLARFHQRVSIDLSSQIINKLDGIKYLWLFLLSFPGYFLVNEYDFLTSKSETNAIGWYEDASKQGYAGSQRQLADFLSYVFR